MSDEATFHSDLIVRLGGKARLAEAFGIDHVEKWHRRGIPSRYWHKVIELGATLSPPVEITFDDLERTKPATSAEAA
jgi:hypothetical protein